MNFKSFGNEQALDGDVNGGGGMQAPGNYESSLARQTSIYSLTFDELQNSLGDGGIGKDFGSMNMDELLKNIWTAEETQTVGLPATLTTAAGVQVQVQGGGGGGGGYLQRQGSLTLPRTLSQKTVDEVWRDMSKENVLIGNDLNVNLGPPNLQQRQLTLGEMTLEEFLVKAGVVREDNNNIHFTVKANNGGIFGEFSRSNNNNTTNTTTTTNTSSNNTGIGIGFQQAGQSMGLMGSQISSETPNLALNFNGVRSSQQQLTSLQPQHQQQQQQQPQQLFPKQAGIAYATPIPLPTSGAQLSSPKIRTNGIVGYSDPGTNGNLAHGFQAGGMGMVGLGAGAVTIANGSPANQLSSDGIGKSNGDTSSVSPVPYVFNGGIRGRRSGAVEKVVERRQRRMIKNRESAARSRARKQAYTVELETEVAKLKEENEELRKKQAEIMELQKNQVLEMINMQQGGKKRCLRRTQTGPW